MEVYKVIPGYEDYQISNLGNVKSTKRKTIRILKAERSKHKHTQYERVTLCKDGKTQRFLIHRLVAISFIPNPNYKPQINHKDNIGYHNEVSNLEWVTAKENMQHSTNQNRQKEVRKLGCKAASLKNQQYMTNYFNDLLGVRFLGYYFINKYRVIRYICKICHLTFTCRSDKAAFRNRAGICNTCNRKRYSLVCKETYSSS